MGGEKFRPTNPQREGSTLPPHIKITLDNGLVVERSEKNSSLKVMDPEGRKAGQKLIDSFVESFREFPRFEPVNVWFDYPVHTADAMNTLKDVDPNDTWQNNFKNKKTNEQRQEERQNNIEIVFENCVDENGTAKLSDMVKASGKTKNTVKQHIEEHGGFWVANGIVGRKKESDAET